MEAMRKEMGVQELQDLGATPEHDDKHDKGP